MIEFEHYDEHVHRSTDIIYAITKRELTVNQVLIEFAKKHGIDINLDRAEVYDDLTEATYTQVGRTYKIKVTKEPFFGNHSVVSLK